MSYTANEATQAFCGVISGDEGIEKPVLWSMERFGGTLKEKICERITTLREKKRKNPPRFESLTFKCFSVTEVSPNLLVRQIVATFSDEKHYTRGVCVALTLKDGTPDAAIVVLKKGRPEIFTKPREPDSEKAYWDKLFNKSMCDVWREQGLPGYEEEDLQIIRESFRKAFPTIWFQPLAKNNVAYRDVLYGLAFEMAKPRLQLHEHHRRIKLIPTAACIKIAVDSGEIEHLEKVFGERTRVDRPIDKDRYELRLSNAKEIVKRAMNAGKDGRCLKEDVDKKAHEIKSFFALTN